MGLYRSSRARSHASWTSGKKSRRSLGDHLCQRHVDVRGVSRDVAQPGAVPLSAIPIALSGEAIHAVVIGGGAVGSRKATTLHEAGATVTVIAPAISDELRALASTSSRLTIEMRVYAGGSDLADFDIVFAATDSSEINEQIAADARSLHRLVNVASDGNSGSFVSMATHRDGEVTIGVTAGGFPKEAMRIRDTIAGKLADEVSR